MDSVFLEHITLHADWHDFLTPENQYTIEKIGQAVVSSDYTPGAANVLRFLALPLGSAKVVIIGQDPYPQPGVATGRAFEVGTLTSWTEPFGQSSLKNIVRAIYKAYTGRIIRYNELKNKLDTEFPILPPSRLFSSWENQGVLLLNTSFTCRTGEPGSHANLWREFSKKLFEYIGFFNPDLIWFLWGTHALQATSHLPVRKAIYSAHPMLCYRKPGRDADFLFGKNNGFERTKNAINWTGTHNKGDLLIR
jgi:uracil-DNA glycosylase